MKVVGVETLQLAEFPFLFWLRVHTDAGIIGTGETFWAPGPVASLHPRQCRGLSARQGSARHRAARPHARQRLCRRARFRRRGARQFGGQHRALGYLRPGARRAGLAAAGRPNARDACRSTTPAPATGMSRATKRNALFERGEDWTLQSRATCATKGPMRICSPGATMPATSPKSLLVRRHQRR